MSLEATCSMSESFILVLNRVSGNCFDGTSKASLMPSFEGDLFNSDRVLMRNTFWVRLNYRN